MIPWHLLVATAVVIAMWMLGVIGFVLWLF
jgi:hypothetical protein